MVAVKFPLQLIFVHTPYEKLVHEGLCVEKQFKAL